MKYSLITTLIVASLSVSCGSSVTSQTADTDSGTLFVEQTQETFSKDVKNRKGWDAPTIADLDQDGFTDVIINDHGYGARIMWNNQGKLTFPYDILMGDLHGISVGDLNFDGELEIIISRGGGSGSNARNAKIYSVNKDRKFNAWPEFDEPLALMRGRTVKFADLDNDGDLDLLNFAFPSIEKRSKKISENFVYENDGAGNLTVKSKLPIFHADGQKTLITDINNDHVPDLFIYGHGKLKVFKGDGKLGFKDVSSTVLPFDFSGVTGAAEIDFDNDGDFDVVLSRGLPFEKGETFYDKESQLLGFYTKRGEFNFGDLKIGDTFLIENYQAPWPEKIPYIGESGYKLEYPGETQSGRTISLISSDALGFPDDISDKKGTHIGFVGNESWRIAGNMFSPFSGVVHYVKDYPGYDHRAELNNIVLENRNGKFVDVSKQLGLTEQAHSTGVIVGDFDNNGYQDIVFSLRGNLIHENEGLFYFNQIITEGERSFVQTQKHGIISKERGASGMSGEVIDFDQDGKLDIVTGNERGQWHLFKNAVDTSNNYLTVALPITHGDKVSSKGAVVAVESCGNRQVKRVGSTGAMYSTSYDLNLHFGLGDCTDKVKVDITWPNKSEASHISDAINGIYRVD